MLNDGDPLASPLPDWMIPFEGDGEREAETFFSGGSCSLDFEFINGNDVFETSGLSVRKFNFKELTMVAGRLETP